MENIARKQVKGFFSRADCNALIWLSNRYRLLFHLAIDIYFASVLKWLVKYLPRKYTITSSPNLFAFYFKDLTFTFAISFSKD